MNFILFINSRLLPKKKKNLKFFIFWLLSIQYLWKFIFSPLSQCEYSHNIISFCLDKINRPLYLLYFLRKCNSIKRLSQLTEVLILVFGFFLNESIRDTQGNAQVSMHSLCWALFWWHWRLGLSEPSGMPFSVLKQLCEFYLGLFSVYQSQ